MLIRIVFEEIIVVLEGGIRGFVFSLGMVVILIVFLLLLQGDYVFVIEDVYGGIFCMVIEVLIWFGIEYMFVDMMDCNEVVWSIKLNIKVIYMEMLLNLIFGIMDIKVVVQFVKENGCLIFLDNIFMMLVLQCLFDFGVDIVFYSVIKFLSGYSDVFLGLVVVKDEEFGKQLYKL